MRERDQYTHGAQLGGGYVSLRIKHTYHGVLISMDLYV